MRTSSQLRRTDACEFNPNAKVSTSSEVLKIAKIQKSIIKRALLGEPITDFAAELSAEYDAADHVWENEEQRTSTITLQALRIERFVQWELNKAGRENKQFREDLNNGEPIVVDFFGEEVEAVPDYIVETENDLIVCKVKTGRFTNSSILTTPEAYCLGKAGEQLANGKNVYVQYLYLGDSSSKYERTALTKGPDGQYVEEYDSPDKNYNKIAESKFDDKMKRYCEEEYQSEKENHTACSPEECASCSMNNICHFEEPPISAPATEVVRPIGEVRLSNDQRNVVDYERGTARVNAGPGSGKTLVVALRVAKLVEKGYDPEKICLLTFTNAGAGEMTARATAYSAAAGVPVDPDRFTSTTFNAFCQQIIDANYEQLGYTRKPRIVPDEVKRGIINRLLDQFPKMSCWTYSSAAQKIYNKSQTKVAAVAAAREFEAIKKEGYTRNNYPAEWNQHYDKGYTPEQLDILFMMYDEFNQQLKEKDMMEFDDQIIGVNKLYEMNPSLFEEMGYEHIIVDEFQDTDLPEIEMLQKMCETTGFKSLMCVGDDSQSIFAFRHTSPEYMVNFGNYFGRFDDFSLVENHRSNRSTITVANQINDLAQVKVDKTLIATKPEGIKPSVMGFYSEKQQYDWIAKQIKTRWDAGNHDIAVIMSDRFQLTKVADALTKYGVPSVLKSPVLVMQNSRVCALTTFYDAFLGRSTQGFLDYRNVVEHGELKGKSALELEEIAEQFRGDVMQCEKTVENFMAFAKALDLAEVDECYQDFLEKVEACRDMEELTEFMEDFKIYGKDSTYKREGRYDGVCLTTIHSAKGLEWDTTFLCLDKLDDEKYHNRPHYYQSSGEMDEQIRKWFVGATRAREELIMTGQYVLKMGKDSATFNNFLKNAYDLCGKAWGYTYSGYEAVRAQEKAESLKDVIQKSNLPTIGSNRAITQALERNALVNTNKEVERAE